MRLAGPAVAEVRTFDKAKRVSCSHGILFMAKLSIKELTSRISRSMILAGGLDR